MASFHPTCTLVQLPIVCGYYVYPPLYTHTTHPTPHITHTLYHTSSPSLSHSITRTLCTHPTFIWFYLPHMPLTLCAHTPHTSTHTSTHSHTHTSLTLHTHTTYTSIHTSTHTTHSLHSHSHTMHIRMCTQQQPTAMTAQPPMPMSMERHIQQTNERLQVCIRGFYPFTHSPVIHVPTPLPTVIPNPL